MDKKMLVNDFLEKNRDLQNAQFERKLIFTKFEIFGLKTKLLEDEAKRLSKEGVIMEELLPPESYEEVLLAGFLLGMEKFSPREKVDKIKKLLPYIDNWATCDAILSRLKKMESESEFFFSLLDSDNPFEQRFGIVWILKYFLKIDIKKSLGLIRKVKSDNYYVKMAKSWAYAEAFLYNFELTKSCVFEEEDLFVKNKAIQKANESFRLTKEQKEILRKGKK